jgi:hypothetical protein
MYSPQKVPMSSSLAAGMGPLALGTPVTERPPAQTRTRDFPASGSSLEIIADSLPDRDFHPARCAKLSSAR